MKTDIATTADMGGGDLPGDSTTTGVLTLGTPVSGAVDSAGDSDWYTVQLIEGQVYTVTLDGDSAGLDPYLTIYHDLAGPGLLASDNNSGIGSNASWTFRAGWTGAYYVAASGFAGTTGAYHVAINTVPVDDVPNNWGQGLPLALGQAFDGYISDRLDSDVFHVSLQAGHDYIFIVESVAAGFAGEVTFPGLGGIINPNLDVLVPQGQAIAVRYHSDIDTGMDFAVNSASWAYQALHSGAYRVTVSEAPADVGGTVATAGVLAQGASIAGAFVDNGVVTDQDWYALTLTGGQAYNLFCYSFGTVVDMTLYGSDGAALTTVPGGTPSTLSVAASGTYYLGLAAHPGSNYNVGAYYLRYDAAPPDLAADATTTGIVLVGDTIRGHSETAGDVDWYAVDVIAGLTYVLRVGDTGYPAPTLTPHLDLVTASGAILASDDNSGIGFNSQIVYTADQSGRLYLSAQLSAPGAIIGDYAISAVVVADDIGQTAATGRSLVLNQKATGTLNYAGDHDLFTINLQAGAFYQLYFQGIPGDYVVRGPDGSIVLTGNNGTYGPAFTATQGGAYTIDVGGSQADDVVDYSLSLFRLDQVGDGIGTLGRISVGQTLTGRIDYLADSTLQRAADFDWYAVALEAGHSYTFTLAPTATGGTTYSYLEIRNAAGDYLRGSPAAGADPAVISFTATTTGIYYIDGTGQSRGDYTLTAADFTAPLPSVEIPQWTNTWAYLPIGAAIVSSVESNGDQDWYRVDLKAGEHYAFTVTQSGDNPLADCYVSLYNENGAKLAWDDDGGASWPNSLLRFTPTTSGTYYVAASGWETATGSYSVGAQVIENQNPLDTIDWGSQLADTNVTVYFAHTGETWAERTADRDWTVAESAAFMRACQAWADYTNLTFNTVTTAGAADMIVVIDDLEGDLAGFMQTPPQSPQVGVFDPYWGTNAQSEGSIWFDTFLHEIGHFLGLAHPHDTGGTSQIMEGVYSDDMRGTYDLNQSVYTVMSYNNGYNGQFQALTGNASTPMPLDIAAVQAKYGVRDLNTGNTSYDVNTAQGYEAILDTGGADTLTSSGLSGATLDLRPATLLNAVGGGGYVSRDNNSTKGFVIAHGVIIENATGTAAGDVIFGNDAANLISGNAGSDVIYGSAGNDTLSGGGDIDTLSFDVTGAVTVDLSLTAAQATGIGQVTLSGFENLTGSAFNDILTGDSGANRLDGGLGNDQLHGTGNDTLVGGIGNDSYYLASAGDVVQEYYQDGFDTIFVSFDVALEIFSGIDGVVLTGNAVSAAAAYGDITLTGNAIDNILTGASGNDRIDGGIGADRMIGSTGNDTFYVDNTGDVVTELFDQGQDVIRAAISFDLGAAWVEDLELTGAANISATGNALDNRLIGNDGANVLDGRGGNDDLTGGTGDTLLGGVGNDILRVNGASVSVVETAGQGDDTAYIAVDFDLGNQAVETLVATGAASLTIHGGAFANRMVANAAGDMLYGDGGNDVFVTGSGADTFNGGSGNDSFYVDALDTVTEAAGGGTDTVFAQASYALSNFVDNLVLTGTANLNGLGNGQANTLTGNSGANRLDGGIGADTAIGGLGNDTYAVENIGDMVLELAGGGTDTVQSSVRYTLGDNLERLTLIGDIGIAGTGNALDNLLNGNSAGNRLDGGLGADTMAGGLGNDNYYIDNAGDRVLENANEGNDSIYAAFSYNLGSQYIENLTLTGTAHLTATGNALQNTLIGNVGDNVLDAGTGADNMWGGAGDDSYYVDNIADRTFEKTTTSTDAGGHDVVYASVRVVLDQFVEDLVITGTAGLAGTGNDLDNTLTGNSGDNILLGKGGNDRLDGAAGADAMAGGTGDDVYYVDNVLDRVAELNGQGNDYVISSVSFNLGNQYVEILTLTGNTDINGTGNALANHINGSDGANILDGGLGTDYLNGALGADTFVFGARSGVDVVEDFNAVQGDRLDLHAYSHGVAFGGGITLTQQDADTLVTLGGNNFVILVNVQAVDPGLLDHIIW